MEVIGFVRLSKLATKWGKPEDDLLEMAANENFKLICLRLGFFIAGEEVRDDLGELVAIKTEGAKTIFNDPNNNPFPLSRWCILKLLCGEDVMPSLVIPERNHFISAYSAGKAKLCHSRDLNPLSTAPLKKTEVAVTVDEVTRMEAEYPELSGFDSAPLSNPPIEEKPPLSFSPGSTHSGRVLSGWPAIAKHLEVSVSTAKRWSKGCRWPRLGPTGKQTTTTTELDAWRLSGSKKKKNHGAK